ncbi:undecaprenyl-diphosphate phosphatase [Limnobacter humi]|uniref:Undecaprenyl-diphosphatase n=1 Tax=Limnobacter humi TaxID=1778671 RepID=A0ABT1WC63_9BURK|nr:undecaprenyl-diphosphate phosphatase [Limnobacter humi]MCQ8895108.1 undecaprenyl-diphosphate phosphatase [Limnobacter humi]
MWDWLLLGKAAMMGVVEGLTEFVPVSSTGHLILTADVIRFEPATASVFEVVIQLAAILAVVLEYKQRVVSTLTGLGRDPVANRFALNMVLAFLPAAVIGLLFGKHIKAALFTPTVVATSFIVGGVLILMVERWASKPGHAPRVMNVDDMSPALALKVGFFQALALIPGTSRSGATIIGSLWLGMNRVSATQFSFFLAMPTMLAASVYELWGARHILSAADLPLFAVGSITSFISAYVCVRWLLQYVSRHDFKPFAWYRIAFGVLILATAQLGWVNWS